MLPLISYLPARALARLNANSAAILVDVRCEAEHRFVGRAPDSVLIPWLDLPDWTVDEAQFLRAFAAHNFDKNTEIILICRSGYRSADAGKCLLNQGFKNVAHVVSGFEGDLDEHHQRGNLNGWRFDGLPWQQC